MGKCPFFWYAACIFIRFLGDVCYNALMQGQKFKQWTCRGRTLTFDRPAVMGIINVTPDSFYANSRALETDVAVDRGVDFFRDGARILDIGGESTRPGAEPVTPEEEIRRIVPVITALRKRCPEAFLSVDTRHTAVAAAALEAGADILNDVSACEPDAGMWNLAAASGAGYILMHARGNPKTMDSLTDYRNVTDDVLQTLLDTAARMEKLGISSEQIAFDPGLGFSKNHAGSLALLADTRRFASLPYPYLVAASRKRFLGEITGRAEAAERGPASVAAALWAVTEGADMVRVHDVRATADALKVFLAAKEARRE